MNIFGYIYCIINAIYRFFMTGGEWIMHTYTESKRDTSNIAVSDKGFRRIKGLEHKPGEYVIQDAIILIDKCKYCGHVEISWVNPHNRYIIED